MIDDLVFSRFIVLVSFISLLSPLIINKLINQHFDLFININQNNNFSPHNNKAQ